MAVLERHKPVPIQRQQHDSTQHLGHTLRILNRRLPIAVLAAVVAVAFAVTLVVARASGPLPSTPAPYPVSDSPPSTDQCTYASPSPLIDCSPVSQTAAPTPSPTTAPACPIDLSQPVLSPDAAAILSREGMSLTPAQDNPNFVASSVAESVAVQSYPYANVCAAFLAVYTDPGAGATTSEVTSLTVWAVALEPTSPIFSHGGSGHSLVKATFLYALVDATTGDFVAGLYGGSDGTAAEATSPP